MITLNSPMSLLYQVHKSEITISIMRKIRINISNNFIISSSPWLGGFEFSYKFTKTKIDNIIHKKVKSTQVYKKSNRDLVKKDAKIFLDLCIIQNICVIVKENIMIFRFFLHLGRCMQK